MTTNEAAPGAEIDYEALAQVEEECRGCGCETRARAVVGVYLQQLRDQGFVLISTSTLKALADEAIGISIDVNPDDDWETSCQAVAIASVGRKLDALVAAPIGRTHD